MDGVKLDRFTPGRVCDVSPSLGSWFLVEGYADLEMRKLAGDPRESAALHADQPCAPRTIGGMTVGAGGR